MATILYVDDEPAVGLIVEDTLRRAGHEAVGARNVPEALHVLARTAVELIISDYRMPGITGLEFLAMLQREGYDVPVIMLTGYASIEHAVASIKAGAVDYITKPVRPQQLELAVEQALEFVRLKRENETLRHEVMAIRSERQIVGDSPAIRRALQTVAMAAPTRATVLLQGESGTGKELFARAIHEQSDRRDKPFITLNCAALPEGLIESALFGHEKGAFTGAIKRVEGAFERAHRGTLLLDEISEMRLDLQAKLLRVLQEQEFERVGGTTPIKVDVRIIATTNRDLALEAQQGRFRQDLYYRLSVIPMSIPALRERPEDIPLLAFRFALRTAEDTGKRLDGIAPETLALLQRYPWPGNVRELQHVIERAVILSPDPLLPPHALEAERFGLTRASTVAGAIDGPSPLRALAAGFGLALPSGTATGNGAAAEDDDPMRVVLRSLDVNEAEKVLITRALEVAQQNRTRAAELLGMSVRTLRNKLNTPGKAED
ncbi:sigma-54-dependent transcriptional regulator [Roseisolibacter agri]|uniref:Acetoacetate metabolism regulatory protein AtoC n=1 Tax=Roseisolibacter agri TaxID=2014610 RepID=A0AA37VAE0_9BACT|nr:sigma-54 dependent transcriptional regulator [Roseisolibacter agri]GLC25348.1 acetoacetate metabolism regulatory protein AtoC [Roseisolibacter agri]